VGRHGAAPAPRELVWEPLALAALNQRPTEAAAPAFARVLAEMFGSDPRAAAIALPTRPLHLMYAEPAREYIEKHGGEVRSGATARVITNDAGDAVAGVDASGARVNAGSVISAVPWFAFGELFEREPALLAATIN